MTYKMIVMDIDGTLTTDNKIISQRTKAALTYAQEKGIIIALASGRPPEGMKQFSQQLEMEKHHGILLAFNGGSVLDAQSKQKIYEKSIPLDRAKAMLKHLENFPVTPFVFQGSYIYSSDKNGYKVEHERSVSGLKTKEIYPMAEKLDFSPVKIVSAAPHDILVSVRDKIMEPFEKEFTFIMAAPDYLDCNRKGISKGDTLVKICKSLHISLDEVIAFGDEQNDLSMIKYAGLGIAMGDACKELKEVADEITLSNNEDGIVAILEKYLN